MWKDGMNMIRFGLIGTSEISTKMAKALTKCPKTTPWAIYSRSRAKGLEFAKKYGISQVCTTLDELAECSDAIYIASPNSLHCAQSRFFLERGIPVLCEKPLGSNEKEIVSMLESAKRNKAAFAEAYKSKWMPAYRLMRELLPQIGRIRNARFDFCKYSTRYDAHMRGEDVNTFRAEFSNGALLDLGVYCLYPALELFGEPKSVTGSGILVPGGVDGLGTAILTYDDFMVTLNYSKVSEGARGAEIQGEKGTIFVDAISSPRRVELALLSGERRVFAPETAEEDMLYECDAFADLMICGGIQDEERILTAFRILDQLRAQVGIVYPADQ